MIKRHMLKKGCCDFFSRAETIVKSEGEEQKDYKERVRFINDLYSYLVLNKIGFLHFIKHLRKTYGEESRKLLNEIFFFKNDFLFYVYTAGEKEKNTFLKSLMFFMESFCGTTITERTELIGYNVFNPSVLASFITGITGKAIEESVKGECFFKIIPYLYSKQNNMDFFMVYDALITKNYGWKINKIKSVLPENEINGKWIYSFYFFHNAISVNEFGKYSFKKFSTENAFGLLIRIISEYFYVFQHSFFFHPSYFKNKKDIYFVKRNTFLQTNPFEKFAEFLKTIENSNSLHALIPFQEKFNIYKPLFFIFQKNITKEVNRLLFLIKKDFSIFHDNINEFSVLIEILTDSYQYIEDKCFFYYLAFFYGHLIKDSIPTKWNVLFEYAVKEEKNVLDAQCEKRWKNFIFTYSLPLTKEKNEKSDMFFFSHKESLESLKEAEKLPPFFKKIFYDRFLLGYFRLESRERESLYVKYLEERIFLTVNLAKENFKLANLYEKWLHLIFKTPLIRHFSTRRKENEKYLKEFTDYYLIDYFGNNSLGFPNPKTLGFSKAYDDSEIIQNIKNLNKEKQNKKKFIKNIIVSLPFFNDIKKIRQNRVSVKELAKFITFAESYDFYFIPEECESYEEYLKGILSMFMLTKKEKSR